MSSEKPTGRRGPKLLEQLARALRARRYSPRTEETYVAWVRSYIQHHGVRRPAQLGVKEVNAFLTHLAVERRASAATQSQARAALLFLYKERGPAPASGGRGRRSRAREEARAAPHRADLWRDREGTSAHEGYTATGGEYALRLGAPLDGRSSATGQGPRPGASGAVDPGRQREPRPRLCHTGIFGLQTYGPDPGSPSPARPRSGGRLRLGCIARLLRNQITEGRCRIWMAISVPRIDLHGRSPNRGPRKIPSPLHVRAESGEKRRPITRFCQAADLPHLPALVRYSPARRRIRHPHHPGAPWPQQREDHHDLHPCAESRR